VKPTRRELDVSGFLSGFLAGFMIGATVAMIGGCERKPVLPPGYSETVTTETYEDGGTLDTHREGSGTGAGLTTSSPEVAAGWEAGSPTAGLDGSAGGSLLANLKLSDGGDTKPLLIAGILALLAAGAAWYFRLTRAALALGVVGVGLIAVSFYPAILLWALLAAGVAGLVLLFSSDANRKLLFDTLGRTTEAVEELPDGVREATKTQLSSKMDQKHKNTIQAVKFAAKVKGKR